MNNLHQGARFNDDSREQVVVRVHGGRFAANVAEYFAVTLRTVGQWMVQAMQALEGK